jgi:hypothetical protein
MSGWIRTNAIGLVALFVALSGTAIAASVAAKNSVTSKSIKNGAVTGKDVKDNGLKGTDVDESSLAGVPIADNSVTSAKVVDGSITSADTADRWALIDGDGTIIAQSGGISVVDTSGAGNYYLDFGSSQAGRSIVVTPAVRPSDGGYGISAVVTVCTAPPAGIPCGSGLDDANHVYVATSDGSGSGNDQGFYIRTN